MVKQNTNKILYILYGCIPTIIICIIIVGFITDWAFKCDNKKLQNISVSQNNNTMLKNIHKNIQQNIQKDDDEAIVEKVEDDEYAIEISESEMNDIAIFVSESYKQLIEINKLNKKIDNNSIIKIVLKCLSEDIILQGVILIITSITRKKTTLQIIKNDFNKLIISIEYMITNNVTNIETSKTEISDQIKNKKLFWILPILNCFLPIFINQILPQ